MKLENVKVGQRVFVTRESTAILDEFDRLAMNLVKTLNKAMGIDIVEICKEKGGFYVAEIRKDGNISLGEKEGDKVNKGWGIYDPSDFELAEQEKSSVNKDNIDVLDIVLGEILRIVKEIKDICLGAKHTEQKRGRGRPKGSTSKKYKKEK